MQPVVQSLQKRKVDEGLSRSNGYNTDTDATKEQKLHIAQASPAQVSAAFVPKPISIPTAATVPYRGTSRPSPTSAQPPAPGPGSLRPLKKGSYAEIMARAKAPKDGGKPVGIIKHKPKDKLSSRKELLMRKQALSGTGNIQAKHASSRSMSENKPNGGRPTSSMTQKPQPSYQGTMKQRPQPTYKGTMTSVAPSSSRRPGNLRDRQTSSQSSNLSVSRPSGKHPASSKHHYAGDEDDEGSGGEDLEEDYDSDDMEAGAEDLFEEEERSARIAKQEDALEMKREMEQKTQKEARKKALQELANKAKRR